jgi:hypothetical protein
MANEIIDTTINVGIMRRTRRMIKTNIGYLPIQVIDIAVKPG